MFFSRQIIIEGCGMDTTILYKGNMADMLVCNSTKLKPHKESNKEHSPHLLIV